MADENLVCSYIWNNKEWDLHRLNHGLVFKTKEEAVLRAKEILKMMEENK